MDGGYAAICRDQWRLGRVGEDLDGRNVCFARNGVGQGEVRIATAPGDYVFVPPYVPHREENPDPKNPAVIVIARSTQEAIVVNLPELYALPDKLAGGIC